MVGKTTQRGYGTAHQRERKRWAREVEKGVVACARCGRPIAPGTPWDLDHLPDRSGYLGPSHRRCNRQSSTHRAARFIPSLVTFTSREW
jgi:hypothetical protein